MKELEPEDFTVFERWVDNYVTNWAACDTLCTQTIGGFVECFPEFALELQSWARSTNRWLKRASAVSLVLPARKGLFLPEIFALAEILIADNDDMVQKGYGWMLKVAGQAHPQEVYDYLLKRKSIMPRTAFRYALEKMPPEWRTEAMKKC